MRPLRREVNYPNFKKAASKRNELPRLRRGWPARWNRGAKTGERGEMTNSAAVPLMTSHTDVIIVSGRNISYPQFHLHFLIHVRCTFLFTFADSAGGRARARACEKRGRSIIYAPFLSIQTICHWKSCNAEKCPERNFPTRRSILKCNDWERSFQAPSPLLFLRLKNVIGFLRAREKERALTRNCDNHRFNTDIHVEPTIRSWITKFAGSLVDSLVKLSLYSMKCEETWFANQLLMLNLLRQLCKLTAGTSARSSGSIHLDFRISVIKLMQRTNICSDNYQFSFFLNKNN